MIQVRFGVLGPLTIERGDESVRLPGRRQQVVLAVLLLDANRVVPLERLVDAVWPEDPPRTAREQIQTAVWRIRRALTSNGDRDADATGTVDDVLLVTEPAGYQLRIEPVALDLTRFEQLRAQARTLAGCSRPKHAARLLAEALQLWRGRPLTGLDTVPTLRAATELLIGRRLSTLEDWASLQLAAGRPDEVVDALAAAAAEHPLRESLVELLVLAEYRCGRQVAALLAYERLRRSLREQLGVVPGPAVREAHRRVLTHDPALTPDRTVA